MRGDKGIALHMSMCDTQSCSLKNFQKEFQIGWEEISG